MEKGLKFRDLKVGDEVFIYCIGSPGIDKLKVEKFNDRELDLGDEYGTELISESGMSKEYILVGGCTFDRYFILATSMFAMKDAIKKELAKLELNISNTRKLFLTEKDTVKERIEQIKNSLQGEPYVIGVRKQDIIDMLEEIAEIATRL